MSVNNSPLRYQGVQAGTPPNLIIFDRSPTINDCQNYAIGDIAIVPAKINPTVAGQVWQLVGKQLNQGNWIQLNQSESTTYLNHQILVGSGTTTINQLPLGNAGQPLLSGGASADPSWGSFVAYAPILGGTTSTGALQSVASVGLAGQVLTSNGAGFAASFQGTGPIGAVTNINVRYFTATGAGTYTPTSGMVQCMVECLGGGGGAGGSAPASLACSPGGGSGGYCRKLYTAAQIGGSKALVVGAGGAGGVGAANGSNGADTTFNAGALTAGGGVGSVFTTVIDTDLGGVGGSASGGDLNIAGTAGGLSMAGVATGNTIGYSGIGANSIYGSGGAAIRVKVSSNGNNGTGYGSGGSGASATNPNSRNGGSGADGIIIITEYIQ